MATISKATVVQIIPHGDDVREYIFLLDKYNYFDPGTFVQLSLDEPKNNRWPESRNFSVASYLNVDKTIRLVIRRIGAFTTRIFRELSIGATCYLKYSFGDFLLPYFDQKAPIVCIAGGTGIAPFISFAEFLAKEGDVSRMHLFYSAKNSHELIGIEELKGILLPQNITTHLTRENKDGFNSGRIEPEQILAQFGEKTSSHFYICGGEEFTTKFKSAFSQRGLENIHTDEW